MPLLLLLALLPAAPISLYADIRPGAAPISSAPDLPIRVGNRIFFTATTEDAGVELWATDGTTAGTQQLTSIGSATGLNYRFAGETKLFFTIDDGDHGEELWISDGTPAGTHLVKDIVPGSGGPNIFSGVVKHDVFYFYATTPEEGGEPWRSDGTEAGTFLIDDINSDTVGADSTPQWFFASSTHVYFVTASAGIKNDVYVVDINNPTTATRVNDGLISAPTTFVSFNGQV